MYELRSGGAAVLEYPELRVFDVADLGLELREDGDKLKFRGYASVFNKLSERLWGFREKVAPGAFAKTIKEADVRFLINHNPDLILARSRAGDGTLELREDRTGLKTDADMAPTTYGRDLSIVIERRDLTQMSIGFRVIRQSWDESDPQNIIRTVEEVQLFDVSAVTFPAFPQTTAEVRSRYGADLGGQADVSRAAIGSHNTAVEEGEWDGPAAVANMAAKASVLRYCHAWRDSDGDADEKGSYKFPHHRSEGAPAILNGVRNGLARLSKAKIPVGDRAGVRRHLRAHLEKANRSAEADLWELLAEIDGDRSLLEPVAAHDPEGLRRAAEVLGELVATVGSGGDDLAAGRLADARRRRLELLRAV